MFDRFNFVEEKHDRTLVSFYLIYVQRYLETINFASSNKSNLTLIVCLLGENSLVSRTTEVLLYFTGPSQQRPRSNVVEK